MRIPVAPFLRPAASSVVHRGWTIDIDGEAVPLPPDIAQWDYQATLVLTAGLAIDRRRVLAECDLDESSELVFLVLARSSSTKIEREIFRLPVPARDQYEFSFEIAISGNDLGGKLSLETILAVNTAVPLTAVAPSRPGSVLWRETHATHLEGSGGQFPTDAEDFSITLPAQSQAGWVLRVDSSDFDALFMSAVRLTLNSGSPAMQKLLGGSKDSSTALLANFLDTDVTRQLVHLALSSEEVVGRPLDMESRTLGAVLRLLLAQLWPTTNPRTLQAWLADSPGRIETQIQHSRRTLW